MSEKQLTVAELMARAAAEGRDDAPRRRRRRNLEDGGVSVAELTGNLPKVDAKPDEPRHTSEPIDAPAETRSQAPAAAPKPAPKAEPAKPEPVKATPARGQVKKPAKVDTKPESKPDGAVPVISIVHDNDPIKLTTDSFLAQAKAKTAESAKKEPAKPESVKPAPRREVKPEPAKAEPRPASVKPKPEPAKSKPLQVVREVDETSVMPVVRDIPEKDIPAKNIPPKASAEATGVFPVAGNRTPVTSNKPPTAGTMPPVGGNRPPVGGTMSPVGGNRPPAVGTKLAAMANKSAAASKAAAMANKPVAVDEDDENISVKSVIIMALTGIVIGAVIFLGFKELWANVNSTLVCILAGVMTLGIVGVVHALRTERDGMSMGLAAVTGAALTFGPLLVVGL